MTLGLGFAAAFIWWENTTKSPMFDLVLMKSAQLSTAAMTLMFAFIAMAGSMFLATLTLQLVKGYSPLQAALATQAPVIVINILIVPRAPWLMRRFGLRRTIAFGTGMTGIAALVLATTSVTSSYWNLCIGFGLMAVAFSVFMPASTEAMMTAVPPEKSGGASALNQISRQTGQAFGIAIMGGIATIGFQSKFGAQSEAIEGVTPDLLSLCLLRFAHL